MRHYFKYKCSNNNIDHSLWSIVAQTSLVNSTKDFNEQFCYTVHIIWSEFLLSESLCLSWENHEIQLILFHRQQASVREWTTIIIASYCFRSTNWTLILFAIFEPCFDTFEMEYVTAFQLCYLWWCCCWKHWNSIPELIIY